MKIVRLLLLGAALAPLVAIGPATRAASRSGQMLVVTTNLKEAFDADDVADPSDMRVYARRLLNQVPYPPDVLMLQEVRRVSARRVASFLSDESSSTYRVAVLPGEPPWMERDGRIIDRETAIVINTDTVAVVGDTGTLVTKYPRRVARRGEPRRVRHHAFASIERLDRSASITAASVHYVQNDFLATDELGDEYKKRWVVQSAEMLSAEAAEWSTSMTVIAGDFNASRGSRDSRANHSHSPWLLAVTDEPYGYVDAVWEVTREGGPDFIMAKGAVVTAGLDMWYETRAAKRDGYFYSDHRFRWAILEQSSEF